MLGLFFYFSLLVSVVFIVAQFAHVIAIVLVAAAVIGLAIKLVVGRKAS